MQTKRMVRERGMRWVRGERSLWKVGRKKAITVKNNWFSRKEREKRESNCMCGCLPLAFWERIKKSRRDWTLNAVSYLKYHSFLIKDTHLYFNYVVKRAIPCTKWHNMISIIN